MSGSLDICIRWVFLSMRIRWEAPTAMAVGASEVNDYAIPRTLIHRRGMRPASCVRRQVFLVADEYIGRAHYLHAFRDRFHD